MNVKGIFGMGVIALVLMGCGCIEAPAEIEYVEVPVVVEYIEVVELVEYVEVPVYIEVPAEVIYVETIIETVYVETIPEAPYVDYTLTPGTGYMYPTYQELEYILVNYYHMYEYTEDVFDCTEMAANTACLLQRDYNINTEVVIGQFDENRWGHAWVMVEVGPNYWIAVEATAGPGMGVMVDSTYNPEFYTYEKAVEWMDVYTITI